MREFINLVESLTNLFPDNLREKFMDNLDEYTASSGSRINDDLLLFLRQRAQSKMGKRTVYRLIIDPTEHLIKNQMMRTDRVTSWATTMTAIDYIIEDWGDSSGLFQDEPGLVISSTVEEKQILLDFNNDFGPLEKELIVFDRLQEEVLLDIGEYRITNSEHKYYIGDT